MEFIEVAPIISENLNTINKELISVIEKIEKYEDIRVGIKNHLFEFILILLKTLNFNNILTIREDYIQKINELVEKNKNLDELEREIIKTINYFDYWKLKYFNEEGFEKYFKKAIENIDAFLLEVELLIWWLLYKRNKEKVKRYEKEIKEMIKKIEEKILEFIPEENITEEERKEIERIIEENKKVGYVKLEDILNGL